MLDTRFLISIKKENEQLPSDHIKACASNSVKTRYAGNFWKETSLVLCDCYYGPTEEIQKP